MKEFIPSTFDPIFKSILTDYKLRDYLCYLISEITDLEYDELYNNLVIENNELMVKHSKEKAYKTDLLVSINKNKINIEANREKSLGLILKNNIYMHSIASNINRGDVYEENSIYQINFNEYNHFKKNNNVIDKVMPMNVETGEIEEETYQKYFINLARLRKKYYNEDELTTLEKRCLPFALTKIEDVKKIVKGDEMLERVYDKMKELNENKSILDMWDSEKEWEKAQAYTMKVEIEKATEKATDKATKQGIKQGVKQGIKQGIKQGMEKGILQRNKEIIKNMKKENIDLNIISKVTGLDINEIETL